VPRVRCGDGFSPMYVSVVYAAVCGRITAAAAIHVRAAADRGAVCCKLELDLPSTARCSCRAQPHRTVYVVGGMLCTRALH
jgi:hypothetical protein